MGKSRPDYRALVDAGQMTAVEVANALAAARRDQPEQRRPRYPSPAQERAITGALRKIAGQAAPATCEACGRRAHKPGGAADNRCRRAVVLGRVADRLSPDMPHARSLDVPATVTSLPARRTPARMTEAAAWRVLGL